MPLLTDLATVRLLLDRDRHWAAYAIGDLAPAALPHCEWHAAPDASRPLVLLYRGFDPPICFAMGAPGDLRPLFAELDATRISLHVRPEALAAMSGIYTPEFTRAMRRMVLRAEEFRPAADADVQPIGESDLAAVLELYEDGRASGESPTFFHPAMLAQGTFRGVWEDGTLIAIAGTHLYSPDLGVCTIGNVYTRRDRRGRGLAARVTSGVAAQAFIDAVRTIVLNVGTRNVGAQRVYERLGFETYCEFLEGEATRA